MSLVTAQNIRSLGTIFAEGENGAPGPNRTGGLFLRRESLYPTELQALAIKKTGGFQAPDFLNLFTLNKNHLESVC